MGITSEMMDRIFSGLQISEEELRQKTIELLSEVLTECERIGANEIKFKPSSGMMYHYFNLSIYLQIEDYEKNYKRISIEKKEYEDLISYISSFTTFTNHDGKKSGNFKMNFNGNDLSFEVTLSNPLPDLFFPELNTDLKELSIKIREHDDINDNKGELLLKSMNDDPLNFDHSNIPILMEYSFKKLEILNSKVEKAKSIQTSIKAMAASAWQTAEKAKDNAIYVQAPSFGKKKEAIEDLQKATKSIAEAVEGSSDLQIQTIQSQKNLLNIQKLTIDYQTRLTAISKGLLGLGMLNLASNRSAIRELELKLKNASKEEIGELARHELISVYRQLKEQQDIFLHIEKIEEKQKKFVVAISRLDSLEKEIQNIKEEILNTVNMNQSISKNIKELEKEQNTLNDLFKQKSYEQSIIIDKIQNNYDSTISQIDSFEKEIQHINEEILNDKNINNDISESIKKLEENQNALIGPFKQKSDDKSIDKLQKLYDDILNQKGKHNWIPTIISLLALASSIIIPFLINHFL